MIWKLRFSIRSSQTFKSMSTGGLKQPDVSPCTSTPHYFLYPLSQELQSQRALNIERQQRSFQHVRRFVWCTWSLCRRLQRLRKTTRASSGAPCAPEEKKKLFASNFGAWVRGNLWAKKTTFCPIIAKISMVRAGKSPTATCLFAAQVRQVTPPLSAESAGSGVGRELPLGCPLLGPVRPHEPLGRVCGAVQGGPTGFYTGNWSTLHGVW